MDITIELIRCSDISQKFIDIRRDAFEDICKVLGIPMEVLKDVNGDQFVRLYSDGSYDVLNNALVV